MTGRLSDRLARIEAATGHRLPLGRPIDQWCDADLCALLGVPVDVSDAELRGIADGPIKRSE